MLKIPDDVSETSKVLIKLHRVATVREKSLENKIFFQVMEKSGKFGLSQRNWQKLEKVREKSGNFKILSKLKCLWQSS